MKFFASKQNQRVTNFALAALLVVSTLTASVPFIFAEKANAAPSVSYVTTPLVASEWTVDRQAPSGGWTVDTSANQRVILNVNQANSSADNFHKTEGVAKNLAAGTDSIKAELYVASDWSTKPNLRVGLWAVAEGAGLPGLSYPIIEYANIDGVTGWRVWNANSGTWTSVSAATNVGGQNTVEIVSNFNTGNYDFYVNDVNVNASYSAAGYTTFKSLIFNNYNLGGATTGNYTVIWKNIKTGTLAVDYSNVYVSPTGSDSNLGISAAAPFKTVQKALDTVATNGTVHLSAGTFPQEKLTIIKNGTTLIGQGRDATKITVLSNASGQGLLAEGLDNITIKSLGVVGSSDGTAASGNALVKLANGQNGIIENVQVESAAGVRTKATGIDINGYSNVRIDNVYVHGLGKDGISVTAKSAGQSHDTDRIRIQGVAVADISWAAIAFYTSKDVKVDGVTTQTPLNNITNVSFGGTSTLQYNVNGIYFEGLSAKTVTGIDGAPVNLAGVILKDSSSKYIINAQSADVTATTVKFDHQSRPGYDDIAAADLTSDELTAIRTNKIIDKANNSALGVVSFGVPLAKSVVTTGGWTNAASTVNWTIASSRPGITYDILYSTDRYGVYTALNEGQSATSYDVSEVFTTPRSYFVKVIAHEGNTSTESDVSEIQVIGSLEILTVDGSKQVNSTATVTWTPIYGREQFVNYEVYLEGELAATVVDQNASSASITLPATTGDVEIYVKANFANNIAGSNFRQSKSTTVTVIPAPVVTPLPTLLQPDSSANNPQTGTPVNNFTGVIGATANQGVLGANTDQAAQSGAADVAGASDDKTAAAVNSDANKGTILGLAWYWWIAILAALAALAWWIIAAIRRRKEEEQA